MNKLKRVTEIPEIFKDFNEWAEAEGKIIKKVLFDTDSNDCFRYDISIRIQYRTINIIDTKYNKHGSSKCSENDEFNANIGITIAYYNMMGWELPKKTVYKKLSEMKQGDIFKSALMNYYKFICYDETKNVFVVRKYIADKQIFDILKEFSNCKDYAYLMVEDFKG